MNIPMKMENP